MSCFKEIRSLNDDKETLSLLKKAANEVNSLLERRGWKVDLLVEFWPNDNKLWGLNVKEGDHITIKIRCRTMNKVLCDYSSIFHTLLHELAHIKCGLHDVAFYVLLESLTKETKGYILNPNYSASESNCRSKAGQPGQPGQGCLSRTDLREKMVLAAEKRMFSIAPRTLGSSETFDIEISKKISPREAAALAAIKRASINDTK